jgi:hypothetical protein
MVRPNSYKPKLSEGWRECDWARWQVLLPWGADQGQPKWEKTAKNRTHDWIGTGSRDEIQSGKHATLVASKGNILSEVYMVS